MTNKRIDRSQYGTWTTKIISLQITTIFILKINILHPNKQPTQKIFHYFIAPTIGLDYIKCTLSYFSHQIILLLLKYRGLYNGKYPPSRGGGGKYQPMSFGGQNMKRPREKRWKMWKKREERGKKKEERGKKIRKKEAKGKNKCKMGRIW